MSRRAHDHLEIRSGTLINGRAELDEILVGEWLHVERMDDRAWHVIVGEHHLAVAVTKKGEIKVINHGDKY